MICHVENMRVGRHTSLVFRNGSNYDVWQDLDGPQNGPNPKITLLFCTCRSDGYYLFFPTTDDLHRLFRIFCHTWFFQSLENNFSIFCIFSGVDFTPIYVIKLIIASLLLLSWNFELETFNMKVQSSNIGSPRKGNIYYTLYGYNMR